LISLLSNRHIIHIYYQTTTWNRYTCSWVQRPLGFHFSLLGNVLRKMTIKCRSLQRLFRSKEMAI